MVKTNTQLSTFFKLIKSILGALALLLISFSAEAQTYSSPTHYYGCEYSYTWTNRIYQGYAAITTVIITDQQGKEVYPKANDQ